MKYFLIYLLIINAAAWLLMLMDKIRARKNMWRIRESVLIGFAMIGGSLGAWLGMSMFRHKTKHPKFSIGIPVIFFLQIAVAGLIMYLYR